MGLLNYYFTVIQLVFLLCCDIYGGTQNKIFEMFYGVNIFLQKNIPTKHMHCMHVPGMTGVAV